jgi:hypothetical protein
MTYNWQALAPHKLLDTGSTFYIEPPVNDIEASAQPSIFMMRGRVEVKQ